MVPGILMLGFLFLGMVLGCGEKTAQDHFDAGAAAFQDEDYDEAIGDYERGLAIEPTSAVGHNLLGMAYRMKYNTLRSEAWKEKEIAAFRLAVAADSTYWPAHINLGASLYYLGEKREAAVHFAKALHLNPENPERAELEAFIREGGGVIPGAPTPN
jgi:tetratricopeptide (TPR) repeat protein